MLQESGDERKQCMVSNESIVRKSIDCARQQSNGTKQTDLDVNEGRKNEATYSSLTSGCARQLSEAENKGN